MDWSKTVLAAIAAMLMGWVAYETLLSYSFRHQGERCNSQRCSTIEKQMERLDLEDKRLQIQIDRLEGHVGDRYTSWDFE